MQMIIQGNAEGLYPSSPHCEASYGNHFGTCNTLPSKLPQVVSDL